MATEWTLKQQASEKEQELQVLREQQTKLLEETIRGSACTLNCVLSYAYFQNVYMHIHCVHDWI